MQTTAQGSMTGSGKGGGVAVIAVHGVADQKPGDTARAIAELLIAAPPAPASYRLAGAEDIGLRVEPLRPSPAAEAAADDTQARQPPTPRGGRPLAKAVAQSLRSDLHRPDWVVDPARPLGEAPPPAATPPGIALTDFLLFKAVRNGMPAAVYETQRLSLQRDSGAGAAPVDVYEMYWADLSRLASGVPRIVTELFTLLFRMSQLGRDTAAAAAHQFAAERSHPRRWRGFSAAQAALDWWFSKGLALLTLQLLMMAFVIVPVGLVAALPGFTDSARGVLAVVLPAAAALWGLYRFGRRWRVLVPGAFGVVSLWAVLAVSPAHWVVGVAWLLLLSLAYDAVMRVCDARFPMTRFIGWLMWPAVVAVVLAAAAGLPSTLAALDGERGLRIFTFGALRGVEWILASTVLWWGFAGLGLFAWMLLGQACARGNGFEGRASVATARLGLFASLGFFVVLVMAAWALLTTPLTLSVAGMQYEPLIFRDAGAAVVAAADFLDARYVNSTETFSLVVVLLLALGLHLIVGTLPSALAEMKLVTENPTRLGRWLTGALRWLDATVMVVAALAVVAAVVVGVALNSRWFGTAWLTLLSEAFPRVPRWSRDFLTPLVWTAASATVALSALGGLLSRYVPWLRAPLDVDSHFREFPRQGIPRSRIFSRFAALLQHVAALGYERVVVVSHSQGTVISAELLRYLRYRAATADAAAATDPAAALWRSLAPRLHLLTAGCPLRQLYASRFPTLYRWVLERHRGRMGPRADELGVQRWVNAYTTGDYVGRWLWTRTPAPGGEVSDTMIDERERAGDVYEGSAQPDLAALMGEAAECDVCLGAGAHTHYFEADQQGMAGLIDQLIAAPWPLASQDHERDADTGPDRKAA
jgi:hypothetical protein